MGEGVSAGSRMQDAGCRMQDARMLDDTSRNSTKGKQDTPHSATIAKNTGLFRNLSKKNVDFCGICKSKSCPVLL